MIGREEEIRLYRDRVFIFYMVVVAALSLIGTRLFFLQILSGEELRRYSEANRLKKEKLHPTRGVIYDRNGAVIVDSRASFDVVLFSQYYPFDKVTNQRLAKALQVSNEELDRKLVKAKKQAAFHSVLLKSDITPDIMAAIEMDAEGFPGVDIEATVQRRYPHGEVAAQLLGYVGEVDQNDLKEDGNLMSGDYIGKQGIERYYDRYLRGINGIGYVEVDARGHRRAAEQGQKLLGYVAQRDPVPGQNLYLTVDLDVELAAQSAMRTTGFNGTVIALDPRSGEILAMVSLPSYHPGLISGREVEPKVWQALSTDAERPLRNRAIQDYYSPASTFKLFLALAGLAEKEINPKTSVSCAGHLHFGNRDFHCWKPHGSVDFLRSIRESCDVFYYILGDRLGVDRIAKYARAFGFGTKTGIKLAGEKEGTVPDSVWKKEKYNDPWHPGETLSVAIGQGDLDVTPLQLVTAYSGIGSGGFIYKPYIVGKIETRSGKMMKEFRPELVRKIDIAAEHFETVKEGLYQVVNMPGATGLRAASLYTSVSGKTGTAQVRNFADMKKMKCDSAPLKDRHTNFFVGYAPRENPEIAVIAVTERSCHSSIPAGVVREVMDAFVKKKAKLMGVPLPDEQEMRRRMKKLVVKAAPVVEEDVPEPPGNDIREPAGTPEGLPLKSEGKDEE